MPAATVSDAEFIRLFEKLKSPTKLARHLGISERCVYARRNRLEAKHAVPLESVSHLNKDVKRENFRSILKNICGSCLIFSDAHVWPNEKSVAYDALLHLIRKLGSDLKVIVCNGDLFDGATISRFGRSGMFDSETPDMIDELFAAQRLMAEIERTAHKDCNLIFTAGNHDIRFTTRIAQTLPEFRGLNGFQFHHHFPRWAWSWSCVINPDTIGETWVKHRWHNGAVTAGYNNVLKASGVHFVTSHTHALEISPYVSANGKRFYGVQTGTLSPIGNETQKFGYAEDNPSQSTMGFTLLTYDKNYRLLPPELIEVIDGAAYFRGQVLQCNPMKTKSKKPKRKK